MPETVCLLFYFIAGYGSEFTGQCANGFENRLPLIVYFSNWGLPGSVKRARSNRLVRILPQVITRGERLIPENPIPKGLRHSVQPRATEPGLARTDYPWVNTIKPQRGFVTVGLPRDATPFRVDGNCERDPG